jgi:signal transduction histidine kinase
VRLFTSLQGKLIVAFVSVVAVALVLSGTVLILVRHDDQEQSEIDRVAAAAPEVLGEYVGYQRRLRSDDTVAQTITEFVNDSATRHSLRVMIADRAGQVTVDSGSSLVGKTLVFPADATPGGGPTRGYVTWRPTTGAAGEGLVLVSSTLPTLQFSPPGRGGGAATVDDTDGRLVLAVPNSTIARAWVSLLPGLGIAALFALPAAVLLAVLLARNITRPLEQLTIASRQMAAGAFDIDVPTGRRDEVGELTEAFSTMAERVGGAHTQMRALVANVSHDLKTPLTSILGFGRALHTGAAPADDVARIGGIIEEEAQRLSTRLNDLLLLSEIDSGKAMVESAEIDLSAMLRAIGDRLLSATPALAVVYELTPGVTALADPTKLERAVENLIDNARKFTPAGGAIHLRTRTVPDSATLEVANTCDDVAPEELAQLFERFYRRDRARSARVPGTGLGLAIARDLVRLQNGTLAAASNDGLLTFTLSLPSA